MKKYRFLLFFYMLSKFVFAQTVTNYWILFSDKNNNPYSIDKPSAYLSGKAILRRSNQKIAINNSDLPVNPDYVNGIKSIGATVVNQSKWFNAITISTSDTGQISKIRKLSYVKEIKILSSPSINKGASKFEMESGVTTVNKEKLSSGSSGNILDYGISFKQANQIGVDCLHNLGFQGQGMTIAVLDAGFYKVDSLHAFDSLRMNHQILGCRDFVTGDTMVFEDFPHGMNVLSCMGGNLPGRLVGTAPKAKFWLLRTEDAATETMQEEVNWLVGAEFADSVGVDMISSSLGYAKFDNDSVSHTYADMNGHTTIVSKAAEWAARKGIFVSSSAGNSGGSPWYKITAPADADSILTVGAVDSTGIIASFSSRGLTSDGRIKPNTVARGVQAIIASQNGDIWFQNGTSFSCPITAGAVACLWQANPTKTNWEILKAIEQSASQFSAPDSIMGYGIPNFCVANAIFTDVNSLQAAKAESFNVYPNPFHSSFDITFFSDKKQLVEINLVDLSGRTVFTEKKIADADKETTFHFVDNEKVSKGIYILQLVSQEKIYYKKVVRE